MQVIWPANQWECWVVVVVTAGIAALARRHLGGQRTWPAAGRAALLASGGGSLLALLPTALSRVVPGPPVYPGGVGDALWWSFVTVVCASGAALLIRAVRRRGIVLGALAVGLLMGGAQAAVSWSRNGGWIRAMPDTGLLIALPYDAPGGALFKEFRSRTYDWFDEGETNVLPPGPWRRLVAQRCRILLPRASGEDMYWTTHRLFELIGDDRALVIPSALALASRREWAYCTPGDLALSMVAQSVDRDDRCTAMVDSLLRDPDPEVRALIAFEIGMVRRGEDPHDGLLKLIANDPHPWVRHRALHVLAGRTPTSRCVAAVLAAMENDPHPKVRDHAFWVLTRLDPHSDQTLGLKAEMLRRVLPGGYWLFEEIGRNGPHDDDTTAYILAFASRGPEELAAAEQWLDGLVGWQLYFDPPDATRIRLLERALETPALRPAAIRHAQRLRAAATDPDPPPRHSPTAGG